MLDDILIEEMNKLSAVKNDIILEINTLKLANNAEGENEKLNENENKNGKNLIAFNLLLDLNVLKITTLEKTSKWSSNYRNSLQK